MRGPAPALAAILVLAACTGDPGATETSGAEPSGPVGSGDAAEWTPEYVDGVLQPLPDGFPSEALTLMVQDEAGSPDGIYGRVMQDALADISPVRVNVVDRPDFGTYGTWEALKFVEEQEGGDEGYIPIIMTVPGNVIDLLTTPVAQDLGVDVTSQNYVIATERVPYVLVTRKDAEWGTDVEAMVEYAQANPDTVRYISRGPGSGLDMAMEDYKSRLDFSVETIIGGSHQEICAAVAAGEGDIAWTLADVAKQFYDDGQLEVLSVSGDAPTPEPWSDRPNMKSVTGQEVDPWGQNRGFFVTPNTPDLHRDWLYELFKAGAETDGFIEARTSAVPGAELVALDHDEVLGIAETAYEIGLPILADLDLLDPSVPNP